MSFTPDRFATDEVEDHPRSGYVTLRDMRVIGLILVLAFLLCLPGFMYLKKISEQAVCSNNVKSIQEALSVYMQQFDDHFPPICAQGANLEPVLQDGKPITWATVIADGMSKRASFRCPSALDDEITHALGPSSAEPDLPMSYGMYSPWSGATAASIVSPGEAIVIAETSNSGAEDTYDPFPFKDLTGKVVRPDGFFIGWDKGNYVDQWQNSAHLEADMPKYVTRLAFFGTGHALFGENARGRHFGKIHVLYADGHEGMIRPSAAAVHFNTPGGDLTGQWTTRGWPGGMDSRR
jgi:hypothetical protein